MKKKVRIYKPTNKFDEGGQQATKFTPDQLISIYMTALSEPGSSPEDAENVLRQIGVDENSIASITDSVENYVDDEQYYNDALSTSDEDAYEDMTADQAAIDAAYQEEQNALALAEEEARSDRMQQMYTDYSEPDYGDDTDVANQMLMRVGGLPPKKTFLKNVIKQIKKQAGGPSENATADSTDPDNKRKEGLQAFTSAVQVDGDIHLAKEDAQRMYEMLATPVGQEESYYEEPDMDYAQFGGMRRGQQRRMNRRLNRIVRQLPVGFSGMPRRPMIPNVYDYTDLVGAFGMSQMPADGSYYRGPKMANIDVRRTGLFGRPKEYSITFADDVYQNPQTTANTAKQKVINKEEEIKDEVKAAEEGTVDQGVEEKKAEEATVAAEDDAPVDINDIQVVSGSRGNSGGGSNIPAKEKITASGPAFKGFWKGYDPKSVRFAGSNKDRAYIQRGSKWFVSPNFTTKDKKNVQWYEVSDPNRIKNIERNTRTIMDPLAPGTTYTISDVNSGVPLGNVRNSAKQYPTSTKGVSDKEIIEGLNAYVNRKIPAYARKYPPMMDNEFKRYFTPSNMNRPVSRTAARNTIGMGEKFQEGGFSDQDSGLFRFIDGGADQGKLTQDPYFAYGGLHKAQTGEETEKKKETPTYLTKEDLDNWAKTMGIDRYMMGYGVPQYQLKQRGLPIDMASGQRYYGDFMGADLAKLTAKGVRRSGAPRRLEAEFLVDDWDPKGTAAAAATQGQDKRYLFGNRPDTAFESRSRALSWLGSKLRPFGIEGDKVSGNYTPEEQKMLRKGYDPNTGLTQEELARRQNAAIPDSTFAFIQPPVADVKFPEIPNVPEAQLQNTSTANAPVAPATQAMSFRKPSMFPTNIEEAQIIPSNYGTADFSKGYVAPETMLEPDYGQAAVEGIQPSSVFQSTQPAEFTQPEQTAMSEDQYNSQLANQNQAAAQDFMLEQIRRQNPEYNQDVYNNPVFNPEEMTTGNIINLNPPIVTPQQLAETIEQRNNKVPTRRQVPSRVIPPKEQAPVVKKQPARLSIKKSNKYDYEQAIKGMSAQERADYQDKQAEGYDETREMKQEAVGDYPKVFRDTYKDYKIPSYIKNKMESFSPLEKAKYMKTLRKVDVNLYYALLNKYFQYGGYMAYGGDLPKAQMYNSQIGAIDPITQDPRFMANYPYEDQWTQADQVDWTETNPIPEDIGEEDMPLKWSQKDEALANAANVKTETGVDLIEGPKVDYGKKRVKVKYNNEEKLSGAERRMRLDLANAAGNRILDLVGQRGDREKERKLRERLLADNLYGSTSGYDRGTYEANSGLFRPDQMGFTGVIKYGGEANYQVGGETYMSEDQIRKFLEEGGELEFV